MVKIQFGKVYRRLDSTVKYISSSALNLYPTIELVDKDPQYSGVDYLPKEIKMFTSNKNYLPQSSSDMILSDTIKTGRGSPYNLVGSMNQISGASTWILFELSNSLDDVEGYVPDFLLRNADTYNKVTDLELSL